MSIKIYHGAPGSYKTSGAVHLDFVNAVKAGRHVITNVRGLSHEDTVRDVLEARHINVPDSFQLTHLDTTERATMQRLRCFHHWAEPGVFFLIDEIQEVFPKRFRDKQLAAFDYHNADGEDRPATLELAFEKHRHHNWDFVVTSPNISKVHPIVRESAEAAYKHRNLATLGSLFKGRYVEGYHTADTSGRAADFYSVTRKKIPNWVFDLYESTATGEVRDTLAGQSLFKNPKLLFLLLVLLGALYMAIAGGIPEFAKGAAERTDTTPVDTTAQTPATPDFKGGLRHPAANNGVHSDSMGDRQPPQVPIHLSFLDTATHVYNEGTVNMGKHYWYTLRFEMQDGAHVRLDHHKIRALGIQYHYVAKCFGVLQFKDFERAVTCSPPQAPPVYDDPQQDDIFQNNQPATTNLMTSTNPFR